MKLKAPSVEVLRDFAFDDVLSAGFFDAMAAGCLIAGSPEAALVATVGSAFFTGMRLIDQRELNKRSETGELSI